jgi:transposase
VLTITDRRHEDHARQLLGHSSAVVTSDRWWAYNHLPVARRQVCWSHLQRDFQAQREGIGAEHELGQLGLEICDELFLPGRPFSTPATAANSSVSSAACSAV